MDSERIIYLLLALPAFVMALTLHEFAHAWMAVRLGDDTPRRMGRLTLDPLAHLDPIGSLMFVVAALSGLPLLAWAKPVPFNPRNLNHPRRDAMLIAVAGPVSNLLQVPFWLFALWLFRVMAERSGVIFDGAVVENILNRTPDLTTMTGIVATMLATGITVNVLIAAFNMIPIPPLDGHYILEGLGPPFITRFFDTIRPFSFLLLFLLIQTPIIGLAIEPFGRIANEAVIRAFGMTGNDFYYL